MRDEIAALTALIDGLGLEVESRVTIIESKLLRYPTATTTSEGTDIVEIVDDLVSLMVQQGWSVAVSEPIDVSQSPASEGHRVAAVRNGMVVDVSVFDQLGSNPAPPGSYWVQLRLSHPDSALAWTQL